MSSFGRGFFSYVVFREEVRSSKNIGVGIRFVVGKFLIENVVIIVIGIFWRLRWIR